jgi:hypothetical protein
MIFILDVIMLIRTILFVWFIPKDKASRRLRFMLTGVEHDRLNSFPANAIVRIYKLRLKLFI